MKYAAWIAGGFLFPIAAAIIGAPAIGAYADRAAESSVKVRQLRCEYQQQPLGSRSRNAPRKVALFGIFSGTGVTVKATYCPDSSIPFRGATRNQSNASFWTMR